MDAARGSFLKRTRPPPTGPTRTSHRCVYVRETRTSGDSGGTLLRGCLLFRQRWLRDGGHPSLPPRTTQGRRALSRFLSERDYVTYRLSPNVSASRRRRRRRHLRAAPGAPCGRRGGVRGSGRKNPAPEHPGLGQRCGRRPAYLAVELGQLLLVQAGLSVDALLVSELPESERASEDAGRPALCPRGSRGRARGTPTPVPRSPRRPGHPDTPRATVPRPCSAG